jgi:co-chaperonin GroES (HSP10)
MNLRARDLPQPAARAVPSHPFLRPGAGAGLALLLLAAGSGALVFGGPEAIAQESAPAPAAARQIGTVKEVSPNKLTITTAAGLSISVNVVDGARVLQLTPGSTDLKSAQAIALGDIEVGDRVLVNGHQDAPDAFTASRVILMKSSDIAQKHAAEQEDWRKRGTGGLVSAVDSASGTITITARGSKISVQTSPSTVYRRYAGGSVKYEDATPSSLAQIQVGDQLRVRGDKSGDGNAIRAEEIVSGSFTNLAGTIVSVDAAGETLTLKDLSSKRTYALKVTASSSVRALPPEAAARFAARARGDQAPAPPGVKPADAVAVVDPRRDPARAAGDRPGGGGAGSDLSQLLNRLPQENLAALHPGDALMVVASPSQPGSDSLTAVTVLSGVEPILAATPKGTAAMTLSPWNVGGGADTVAQ